MNIRPMAMDDCNAIILLEPIIFPAERPWSTRSFQRYFDKDLCFVSYDDANNINGYIFARQTEDYIEINNIGVLPTVRGRGIASLLLETVLETTRKTYYDTDFFLLQVRTDNAPAIALYEKYNFYTSEDPAEPGYQSMRCHVFPDWRDTLRSLQYTLGTLRVFSIFSFWNRKASDPLKNIEKAPSSPQFL